MLLLIGEQATLIKENRVQYKLEKLEAKLSTCNNDRIDIKDMLDKGINNLPKLEHMYEN